MEICNIFGIKKEIYDIKKNGIVYLNKNLFFFFINTLIFKYIKLYKIYNIHLRYNKFER